MKTYTQLTEQQQQAAVDRCLTDILKDIIEEGIRYDDKRNGDDLQARIDAAAPRRISK